MRIPIRTCQTHHKRSDLTMMIIKPHANRKEFSNCHIETAFFVMWNNIKRDRKFDPCNDFMQIYLIFKKFRSKSPYSVSISQLFSKKCHRNHPLKSHSRIDYAEIKLNNEKKNQNPFHSMTPATTPQTIVLESFLSTSHRPLE